MQGIFRKENTDKALKYGIYRHLPTYEKIIRNLVSFYFKNGSSAKKDRRPVSVKPNITLQNHSDHKVINSAGDHADGDSYHEKTVKQLIAFFFFRGGTKDQGTAGRKWADGAGLGTKDRAGK